MITIEFSDSISSGEREFSITTKFDADSNQVISTVAEHDHQLQTYSFPVKTASSSDEQQADVEALHLAVVEDWKLLFYIYEKVKNSHHAASFNSLGLLFMSRNLLPEAIESFSMAIQEDEKFIEAYLNLGKAFLKTEIYSEAIEVLNRALEISPDYPDLNSYLGIAYMKRQDFQLAVDKLEKALLLNPHYDLSHFMLGMTYLQSIVMRADASEMIPISLRQKKIIGHLQKAMDLNHFYEHANIRQAMKEIQDENYHQAVELLREVEGELSIEKENHYDDEFYLNFMFGGKSKDDRVISEYIALLRKKIGEKPDYPDLHNNLGIAYLIQCRNMFLKAMEQFRIALKINPKFKNAKKNLKLAENEGKGFIILLRALLK